MLINFEEIIKKYNLNLNGVIHVGGHIGEEIELYKKYTDKIHIFEPLEECFNKIPNSVNKYLCALGSENLKKDFYVSNNKQSSSFLEPKKHLEKHPEVAFREKRLLEIKTLDFFNIEDCNFMNIDVQGFELEVLRGSEKTLNFVEAIYTEINTIELYDKCVLLSDLDEWLKQRGFLRKEIMMFGECGWGDAFYLKESSSCDN